MFQYWGHFRGSSAKCAVTACDRLLTCAEGDESLGREISRKEGEDVGWIEVGVGSTKEEREEEQLYLWHTYAPKKTQKQLVAHADLGQRLMPERPGRAWKSRGIWADCYGSVGQGGTPSKVVCHVAVFSLFSFVYFFGLLAFLLRVVTCQKQTKPNPKCYFSTCT